MEDATPDDLELAGFEEAPGDQGLSLDHLSESFARLLGQGDSPYEDARECDESATVEQVLVDSKSAGDWPITPKGIVEAILFVGDPTSSPISGRYIASLMQGVRADEVAALVDELNSEYRESGCPYVIEPVDSGFRLVLREEFEEVKVAFAGKVREAKLSQAAVDVLAVIAYQQPIPKRQLRTLLGDSSGRIAGQLIRRGLLCMHREDAESATTDGGKSAELCYSTTDRFLTLFGLRSLNDLPTPQDFERL